MYNKPLLFVSYTTKDGEIDREILSSIKNQFNKLNNVIDTYIDLIDNYGGLGHQQRVLDKARKAKVLLLIRSSLIEYSKWVEDELTCARKKGTPIIDVLSADIKQFTSICSSQDLHNNWITKRICRHLKQSAYEVRNNIFRKKSLLCRRRASQSQNLSKRLPRIISHKKIIYSGTQGES